MNEQAPALFLLTQRASWHWLNRTIPRHHAGLLSTTRQALYLPWEPHSCSFRALRWLATHRSVIVATCRHIDDGKVISGSIPQNGVTVTSDSQRAMTLADIAQLAGVSRSAASRALDARAPVQGPRADRVRAIAAEHGYVPNSWAANLRRQRTGLIGVVVPRLTDTVMAMLYEAIVDHAAQLGYQATVVTTGDDPRKELERGRALVKQRVDGFILTTARTDGADPFLLELKEKGIPHALALRADGQSAAAVIDDELGGELATRHLLEHGHRNIAFIGGPAHASSSQAREAGFRRAMEEYGAKVQPGAVHYSDFSVDAGLDITDRLLALANVPTAVFTANDSLALGVMSASQRAGIRVPEQLSVVGYNDTPLAQRLAVPLTSVRVSFDEVAARAVGLLFDPENTPATPVVPFLVERSSVAHSRA